MKALFYRYDGPTWLVACMLYGLWALLIACHRLLPWWLITPLGAYLVAWHFSLQHEAIHSFRSAPQWLRTAVAESSRAAGCASGTGVCQPSRSFIGSPAAKIYSANPRPLGTANSSASGM